MIVMALDHVRDFIHHDAMSGASPTDLRTTTAILFFTRWITHFCAPVFMFTAGLGAFFYWNNGRTKAELSRFLLARGLWLIFLELTVMQLTYNFDIAQKYPIFLIVLWVLGACMVVLSALVWLPMPVLAIVSILTIVLHNTLDSIRAQQFGSWAWAWNLLHQVGAFPVMGRVVIAAYSLVPWFAVMAAGFCFGPVFLRASADRRRVLLQTGAILTIGFPVLRAVNGYGDFSHWTTQSSPAFTVLSFLNTSKYPPSLLFLLMTLGPATLLLAYFDARNPSPSNPLVVFGRVPLFYFVLHFFLAHLAIVLLSFATYGGAAASFMFQPVPSMGGPRPAFPADFGYPLWAAYLVWAGVVIATYPLCRWFAGVKARRRDWWLSYL